MSTTTLARNYDTPPADDEFGAALIDGLSRRQKSIPCKFFYDRTGSQLFDRICSLPEYYPTRTEVAILREQAPSIARLLPHRAVVIEPGGGSCTKIGLLLDALVEPAGYAPVDISAEHLRAAARELARTYPRLSIVPVFADFSQPFALPKGLPPGPRVGFFPGSTIGNFHPDEAGAFLEQLARCIGDGFVLIGVDLKKPVEILLAAYNDAAGVTAAFNLNVLARANRDLGADFDVAGFRHEAIYNATAGRIEMYLISRRKQMAGINGRRFAFAAGEAIHTENSYKYDVAEFRDLAASAGLRPVAAWTDKDALFSLHLLAVS